MSLRLRCSIDVVTVPAAAAAAALRRNWMGSWLIYGLINYHCGVYDERRIGDDIRGKEVALWIDLICNQLIWIGMKWTPMAVDWWSGHWANAWKLSESVALSIDTWTMYRLFTGHIPDRNHQGPIIQRVNNNTVANNHFGEFRWRLKHQTIQFRTRTRAKRKPVAFWWISRCAYH